MKHHRQPELPLLTTVTLGHTRTGEAAAAVVTSQGRRVVAKELLDAGHLGAAEAAVEDELHRRVFLRAGNLEVAERVALATKLAPLKGSDVVSGDGYGLVRRGQKWWVYRLSFEGDVVTQPQSVGEFEDFAFAFDELHSMTHRHLLRADRREA